MHWRRRLAGGFLFVTLVGVVLREMPGPAAVRLTAISRHLCGDVDVESPAHPEFDVERVGHIKEYNLAYTIFRHRKTGAEVLSVRTSTDDNKVFAITFRTPPSDSTGLPHILEHSVLCGSQRYPVKEPFVRLIQGSLNTFLNAFTYPDRTVYPVASRNLPDFYNLASVYLDAVFYPRAAHDPRILAQEGWHYELENASDPLTVTGVVLNEMKGVYSNPEALLARVTQQALFPDNAYSVDSGGDPALIPTLEFRDFQLFHETFYSPSNARLYFYGDDPEIARLDLAHASLSAKEHSRGDPQASAVKRQPALRGLDPVRTRYPAQSNSSGVYTTLNWVLNEFTVDADTALALAVVDHLLLGTSASILRLRLIQTGLGDTVVGGGLDTTLQHMTFSVGLKGVKTEENASAVIDMVNMCLAEVAEVGFSDDAIEASVNTIEFQLREFNTGGYPKGLILLLNALNTWIYDGDPFEYLRYDEPLRRLKAALHAKSPVLKNIVKRYLVNNEHRVAVYLIPDDRLEAASQAKETATLSATKLQMNTADIEQILEQTRELKKMQSAVDSDDALRTIPRLSIMDLVRDERETPPDIMQAETGGTILTHSLSTNGIVYIDLCVEMTSFIPSPDVPFLPLFERLLLEVDTANHTRVDFSRLIAAKTGGLRVSHTVVTPAMENPKARVAMEEDARLFLTIRGKCTLERMNDLFQIVYDALFSANLGDRGRIIEILRESVSSFKTRVVSSGHVFVASTIGAHGTTVGSLNERLAGISAFRATERMLELANAEDTYEHVLTALERLRRKVLAAITSSACVINISADGESLPTAIASARHFLKSSLHSVSKTTKTVEGDFDVLGLSTGQHGDTVGQKHANPILGFTIPTTVNYVGSGGRLFDPGEYVSGTAAVAVKLLSTRYLWEKVRVTGGAYGAFCNFNRRNGVVKLLSYRDPNLLSTLSVFRDIGNACIELADGLSRDDLELAIIGTIGDLDAPQSPDQEGFERFVRWASGETHSARDQWRADILGTTNAAIRDFGMRLVERIGGFTRACIGSNSAFATIDAVDEVVMQVTALI